MHQTARQMRPASIQCQLAIACCRVPIVKSALPGGCADAETAVGAGRPKACGPKQATSVGSYTNCHEPAPVVPDGLTYSQTI